VTLGVIGLIFQLPIVILAVSRLGIVTPKQFARNRRYAYLVIAVVAMVLPGTDPISKLLEMVPLIVLFEASLVLARVLGTPAQADPHAKLATAESTGVTAAN
jgi:sec-independent protein translocase protein TatC